MRSFVQGLLKFLAAIAVLLLVVGGVLFAFFVKVVEVGHNAMAPSILTGDRVLVWNKNSGFEPGDVVLCPHPDEPNRFVLGRVAARPGAMVQIYRGELRVNRTTPSRDLHGEISFNDEETGRTYDIMWGTEQYGGRTYQVGWRRRVPDMREHRVRGGLYLLSDFRSYQGEDSRRFGEVPETSCIGLVIMRLTAADGPAEFRHRAFQFL